MGYRNSRVNNDPRVIKAKYDCNCWETGERIEKGEECIYYPRERRVFHIDLSKQSYEFRNWQFDCNVLGQNY